ncbi:MAG TPA: hypothetical protein VFM37_01940, partial [Pseudonocardiaceae bacterium]|nr:hypothetical protein [Pseudonocardiaceae bacterium]
MEIESQLARIRFAHALVRDAVYASMPPARRAALHRTSAGLLEPLARVRDEWAGAVALHWHRAGEPGRSVGWARLAAGVARAAAAHDETIEYLELALDALDHQLGDGDAGRDELLRDLARAQYLAGRIQDSIDTCEQAAEAARRAGRADIVARSALVVQGIGDPAINHRVERLCRQALAQLDDSPAAQAEPTQS